MRKLDIGQVLLLSSSFRPKLEAARDRVTPRDFEWYPYDSLANIRHLDDLLTGPNRRIFELIGDGLILDAGGADGDLAFFLESLGCRVQAIDHPVTSHNSMAGIKALKAALGSQIGIHEIDLDDAFVLPDKQYAAVFLLGLLYHLKNPFYVLERLSKHVRYCFLSTRIAKRLRRMMGSVTDLPIAYLLDDSELNVDNSNYWIFSEAGLRRLLKRTNWEILDWMCVGESKSDPVKRDERAFCLMRSTYALGNFELLKGWHDPEGEGWRWTEKQFSLCANIPPGRLAKLTLTLYLPPGDVTRWGSLTLFARANGVALPSETFRTAGYHTFIRALPACATPPRTMRLDFTVDHVLPPDDSDARERAVVVASVQLAL